MSKVLRVLTEARNLISDEARWTRNELARDANGHPRGPTDRDAVCWCAEGAIRHILNVSKDYAGSSFFDPWIALQRGLDGRRSIAAVNDDGDHLVVLRLFDAAIAAEQAKTEGAQP